MAIESSEWLLLCRSIVAHTTKQLNALTEAERSEETGEIGAGGDHTLLIDALAEDAVFATLQALHDSGEQFSVISEERGAAAFGAPFPLLAVDPVDGSLNARRNGSHYALSLAVSAGPTVGDVIFGYVYDFGAREEFWASRDGGAFRAEERLSMRDEERTGDGRIELLAIETNESTHWAPVATELSQVAHKFRTPGSIAVAICQLAAGRVDAMANLSPCRSIDVAAAVLIARETGAVASFPSPRDSRDPMIDLDGRRPFAVARSVETLARLSEIVLRSSQATGAEAKAF